MQSIPATLQPFRTTPRSRWQAWLLGLLLLAVTGFVFHPLVHHQPSEECDICLQSSGASPLPATSLDEAATLPAPIASILPALAAPLFTAPHWRQPPGRAPPALTA